MKNIVIQAKTEAHGAKIIEWFKSKGVDTHHLVGNACIEKENEHTCYGVDEKGYFDLRTLDNCKQRGFEIINLPEEFEEKLEYPRVMEVSDTGLFWFRRVVFMGKEGVYLAWSSGETMDEVEKVFDVTSWKYAREIEPVLQVTLEEVAKKFGVREVKII